MIEASKAQLLNYLYLLYKKGLKVKGEIRIPKEKKIIKIELTEKDIEYIKNLHSEIKKLINQTTLPQMKWSSICKKCSYAEFCWA
jgi:CRISPR-associated exonuclease Cas4